MKIIIFGTNDTGYLIANAFNQMHDITLMDDIEELPSNFEKLDIQFIKQLDYIIKVIMNKPLND